MLLAYSVHRFSVSCARTHVIFKDITTRFSMRLHQCRTKVVIFHWHDGFNRYHIYDEILDCINRTGMAQILMLFSANVMVSTDNCLTIDDQFHAWQK